MKDIQLLGATGSIGTQTVEIIEEFPHDFRLQAVSARDSVSKILEIAKRHDVGTVVMAEKHRKALERALPDCTFLSLEEGGLEAVARSDKDAVLVNALVGSAGLPPTLAAAESGKDVLLANKESLVVGGELIKAAMRRTGAKIVPIDSEHSALAGILAGNRIEDVEKLVITASGGSLRHLDKDELEDVSPKDALKHPNWQMGAKITIDSATMMNKVFEVIEAHHLFDVPYERIEAILHEESVVHALVHFKDGNVLAHMGPADMRIPILTALQGGERKAHRSLFDLTRIGTLHFALIDSGRYPLFDLGLAVAKKGGLHTVTLNAANEAAVALFLAERISFREIETLIKKALDHFRNDNHLTLEKILSHDALVRKFLEDIVKQKVKTQ